MKIIEMKIETKDGIVLTFVRTISGEWVLYSYTGDDPSISDLQSAVDLIKGVENNV